MTGSRRFAAALVSLTALLGVAVPGLACPFCTQEKGPTMAGDFERASLVIYGRFTEQRLSNDTLEGYESDFAIERVLKPHAILKGRSAITLPRRKPPTEDRTKFVLFCDVYKGKIDPYRGAEVPAGSQFVKYLEGSLALKGKPRSERLRYCFDYLNSPEIEISLDAYREYAEADYKDYKEMARKLPPNTITGWLQDPKTPSYRYGLYASLLGHCGKAEHAKVLRAMIDDPERRRSSGIDGLLAGYVMLEPKQGWQYLYGMLDDGARPFLMRYQGLRTVRFLWEQRPDLVDKATLVKGVTAVLQHPDMADFAIEDLRKWQRWEKTDAILDLAPKKSHASQVIQKSILRFALQSPAPRAAAYVRAERKRDAEWVADTEELLKSETAPASK